MIYLLLTQKLKHNNYSEQRINMRYFIQATEYDMRMHAKFQDLILYIFFNKFLQHLNSWNFMQRYNAQIKICSSLLHWSAQEDSKEIYFAFFLNFYEFI
jgi:hypothetical protein